MKLLVDMNPENEVDRETRTIWQALKIIVIADVTMSLDNMLGVGCWTKPLHCGGTPTSGGKVRHRGLVEAVELATRPVLLKLGCRPPGTVLLSDHDSKLNTHHEDRMLIAHDSLQCTYLRDVVLSMTDS